MFWPTFRVACRHIGQLAQRGGRDGEGGGEGKRFVFSFLFPVGQVLFFYVHRIRSRN